jgi:hypothetical protein
MQLILQDVYLSLAMQQQQLQQQYLLIVKRLVTLQPWQEACASSEGMRTWHTYHVGAAAMHMLNMHYANTAPVPFDVVYSILVLLLPWYNRLFLLAAFATRGCWLQVLSHHQGGA